MFAVFLFSSIALSFALAIGTRGATSSDAEVLAVLILLGVALRFTSASEKRDVTTSFVPSVRMTTFKDVATYFEVGGEYLDASMVPDSPIDKVQVLRAFDWVFKGGSMADAAAGGKIAVTTSNAVWPNGHAKKYAEAIEFHLARKETGAPRPRDFTKREAVMDADAKVMLSYANDRLTGRELAFRKATLAAHYATWTALTWKHDLDGYGRAPLVEGAAAIYGILGAVVGSASAKASAKLFGGGSDLRAFIREMVVLSALGSNLSPVDASEAVGATCLVLEDSRIAEVMEAWKAVSMAHDAMTAKTQRDFARDAGVKLLAAHADGTLEDEVDSFKRAVRLHAPVYDLGAAGVLQVMQGVAWLEISSRESFVLGKSSCASLAQALLSYASQLVASVADAVINARKTAVDPISHGRRVLTDSEAILSNIIRAGAVCTPGSHVTVCKSYKRAFAAYYATLSGPCAARDKMVLEDLALEVGGVPKRDLMVYWEILNSHTAQDAHNIGKLFKVCPPPDVSPGQTMLDRIEAIKNPNTFVARYGDLVIEELERAIVLARCKMPGPKPGLKPNVARPAWWAHYMAGRWDRVPTDDLPQTVAWEASLDMPSRSPLEASVWKDSSVGADSLAAGLAGSQPRDHANMKTRMLRDPECPMPNTREPNAERVVQMLIKGEAHKDPARAIFSSNMRHRFRQSLLELAVERVAKYHPSFMMGTSPEEMESLERLATEASGDAEFYTRYYSFDVSGWSSGMSADIQIAGRKIWQKLYGDDLWMDTWPEMADATVYLNKAGYIGWYKNTGSNLEGFDGKFTTMINVALLSATVKVWRAEAVASGLCTAAEAQRVQALLFSYIDDGMAKIDFPGRAGQVQVELCFALFRKVAQEVFKDASFTLDPPKCFPSDVFFVFLNEAFVAGRKVTHGTRAASGICGDPMEDFLSLPECMDKVTSGCRGVTKAGHDATATMFLHGFHSYFLLKKWVKCDEPCVLARWVMLPKAWGGLGVPKELQMASTASGEAFAEGVDLFQMLGRATPVDRVHFGHLCTMRMTPKTRSSVLTAPLGLRCVEGYMAMSHTATAVRRALESERAAGKSLSTLARQYMDFADPMAFADYAMAVVPERGVVQEVIVSTAAAVHPQAVFAQFARSVESARTLRNIIGPQAYRGVVASVRREARIAWAVAKNRYYLAMSRIGATRSPAI